MYNVVVLTLVAMATKLGQIWAIFQQNRLFYVFCFTLHVFSNYGVAAFAADVSILLFFFSPLNLRAHSISCQKFGGRKTSKFRKVHDLMAHIFRLQQDIVKWKTALLTAIMSLLHMHT